MGAFRWRWTAKRPVIQPARKGPRIKPWTVALFQFHLDSDKAIRVSVPYGLRLAFEEGFSASILYAFFTPSSASLTIGTRLSVAGALLAKSASVSAPS